MVDELMRELRSLVPLLHKKLPYFTIVILFARDSLSMDSALDLRPLLKLFHLGLQLLRHLLICLLPIVRVLFLPRLLILLLKDR